MSFIKKIEFLLLIAARVMLITVDIANADMSLLELDWS